MYCKKCREQISDDSLFCEYCGFNQKEDVSKTISIEGKRYPSGLGKSIEFYDNYFLFGKNDLKKYDYSYITKIKVKKGTGWGRNKGTIDFYADKLLNTIWFDESEYYELDELYEYISKRSEKERIKKYEENTKERRFKCNVCGKIFCYTNQDVKENQKNQLIAGLASVGTIASAVGGSRYDMYEQNKLASNTSNRIVDYSKCPNCGSKDLKDITNEDNKEKNNNLDNIEAIKKYKELLDIGAITQEEFDKKKNDLLNM